MSLGPMSHVEFKKKTCRPVDFRDQGPSWSVSTMYIVLTHVYVAEIVLCNCALAANAAKIQYT